MNQKVDVRCSDCGRMLGERVGSDLWISKIGLVVQGGSHLWRCKCGRPNRVDLDTPSATTLDARPVAAVS